MKVLPSKADPCIWLRKEPNLRCYEYIAEGYLNGMFVDQGKIGAELFKSMG